MRKHQFGRKIAAVAMAAVMTVSAAFSGGIGGTPIVHAAEPGVVPEVLDSASTVNYAAILGRATDFGIVAQNFHQNNHMETTFAINNFYNPTSIPNEVDFPLNDFTAQFVVGNINEGKFHLGGNETAKVYNIETSEAAANGFTYPWLDENNNLAYTGVKGNFQIDHNFYQNGKVLNVIVRENIDPNIGKMISDVKKKSDTINTKANDPKYVYKIPDSDYWADNAVTIDLTDAKFKGKVVYINVDSKLASRFDKPNGNGGQGQGVHIKKDPSTVVVFNFAENLSDVLGLNDDSTEASTSSKGVKISKFEVSTDGGATWVDTDSNNSMSEDLLKKKDAINQTVIFNVVADGPVELNTCGGAVLVPGSNKVNISGSSMGWLVSGGTAANNHAEWHYLYRGGNQEYSSDGSGQIHFAAKKAITDSYNGANTVSDDTFEIGANAYSFNWYETDKDYNITGVTPQVVSNQSTSTIKFPELSFFGSDPVKEATYVTETKTVVFNTVGKDSHDNDAIEINESEFISQINSKVDGLKIIINYDGVVEGSKDIGFDGTAGDWNTYLDGGVIEAHSGAGKTVEVSGEDILKILNADTISKFRIRGYNGVKLNSVTAQYPVTKVQYKERNLTKEEKDYYVEDGKSKDFYYYIDEVGAGTVDAQGVEISKGYIKIHLQVTNNGGDLSYAVDSTTILGNGETYFTNGSFGNESIVNMSGVEFGLLEFFNKINGIEIDKVAVAGGPEIAGAKLTITALGNGTLFSMYPFKKGEITATRSSDTTVIDVTNSLEFNNKRLGVDSYNSISFVTEKDMHTVLKGLPNGNYTLTETLVPENYAQAETIAFTVKDGVVTSGGVGNVITMLDKINVNISKIDLNEIGVEGAKLEIQDVDGKRVGEVLDGFNNKSVQNVSLEPGTYTLVETTTPTKYRTADPIKFTVKEDGTIEREDKETVARKIGNVDYNNILVMINEEKKNELVITKTIDGANVTDDDLENLKFTVQNDSNEYLYKDSNGTVQYSKDKVEIALKDFSKDSDSNVYTYRFKNIPTGDYTVSETQANIPGYNIEYVKINDTAITKDTDNAYVSAVVLSADGSTVKIEDSYTPIVGDLEITKTIDGKNVTADDLENLKFTVQNEAGEFLYKDDKGNVQISKDTVTIALNSFEYDSNNNVYKYKFDDIPVGNYTVKETQANIAGYEIEYVKINDSTVTAGTDKAYTSDVVLTEDGKTVKIEDKYNQIVGDLEITKTIDGKNVTSDDLENLKFTVQNNAGEFLYKDNKGNVQTSKDTVTIALNSFEYDSNNNVYKYKFDDIPVGNYTVKETQANIAGYEIEYVKINDSTVTAGTDKAYTSDVVLTKDGKTVKIEDKYNQIVGDLEITKTIDGKNVTSDDLENLKFTVQNDAGEFLYKDDKGNVQTSKDAVTIALNSFEYDSNNKVYKYKFDDIPVGNYTVKETQANIAGYEIEYVKINDSTVTAGTDKAYTSDVVLTKDGKTVKIEDKYTQNAGNLEFIKTVTGGVTKEEADGALTFQVTTGTGSDKKYLTADGKLTTTETTLKVTDKCFTATTDTDGNVIYKATFAGIEVGQYSIVEKNTAIKAADGSNYTYTFVKDESVTSGTAKVEKGKTATVSDLKDVYEKKTNAGNLEFIKTVTGGVTKEEADGALTFQVTTGTGSDKKYLTADGKLTTTETILKVTDNCFSATTDTDGNVIYKATFAGIEVGEYSIVEKNTAIKAADGSNYTYTFVKDESVTSGTAKVEKGKTATVSDLKDVYEKKTNAGNLEFIKTVTGGVTKEEADGALTFQVTTGTGSDKKYLTADGTLTTTETTLKVTDNCFSATTDTDGNVIYKATFTGIEVGEYSIVEKNTAIKAADGSNYTYTFVEDKSVTSGTAKVESGKTATVSDLKDVYEKKNDTGNLEFIKTVTGGVTKEEADGALTFQVTTGTGSDKKYLTADGTLTTTETTLKVTDSCFSETTDTDGNLIYTATFTGLDLGEYVVTETNTAIKADDGSNYTYTFEDKQSVTGTTVTVENGKTATAELSDVYTKVEKTGSLVITKSFAKDCITEAEKEGGLQFTVTTKIGEDTFYLTSDGKLTDTKTIFTLNPDFTYDSDSNSWSKKFENVPIGTYTVEEVNTEVEGYKFKGSTYNGAAGTKGEITVEADEEAVENIVDEYEKVASLTVKKAVVDSEAATAASNKTFKIALKDADGNFYNGTEFTTSAKYYDVKAAGSVTFKDLPVDKTYTIVEDFGENNAKVNITGFTFNGFTAAPVDLTQDATVTVTNDYTRDKGNLVITKLVKGPVTEDEFNGALTFSITDKNGKAIAVTKNDGTTGTSDNMTIKDYFKPVSSGNNEFKYELVIENVPTDTYTVTETNSTFDGYELVSKTGGGKTTVVKGEDAVSNFVDEYKQVTGSLEIVKNFKDAPSNLDASKIVFKVSGPKLFNNGEDLTVTYDKFTSGKYVIDNAPIGEYTVTETSYEDSKIDGNYKYTFSTGASTVTGKTTVIKDTKANVTLLNVYDKEEILGSLTISKTVAMNDGSEVPADTFVSDKTFRVSVQNTDTGLYVSTDTGKYSEQPVWFDIKAGSPVVIKNIKLGNYTVSEDVADATAVDYRIIYVGSASVSEGTATLTTDARDGSVALSNVYKHYEKEDIIDYPVFFSKEDSLSGAEVAGATIELYKGDKAEGTPVSTWISTLTSHVENLEPGTYTFKETVAPKGYDIVETAITFTVDKDDSEKGYSVKLIDLSDEVCYQRKDGTLVLKDDPMLGILKVVKVVETDTGNKPVVNGFNVTVKNLKNNKYVTSIDGTLGDEAADIFVPIDSTGVGSVEITGLRPAKYLVIEKEGDKALKGFIYDANGSIAELEEEITLTDKGASTAEIELANKYFENIGNLEITKKVTGDNPGKTDFEVTVTNEDGKFVTADGKLSDDKTVLTVKVGETLTIKNVPSGKYTVSEDLTDAADVTGFKFNSENSVSAKDATVTQGATAAVELINDYSEVPTGHLYVHVTEEKSGLDVPDATVTVTNKTTGETTEFKTNSKGEIVDDNGLTPELPVGDYTVVVSEVPEGYEVTTGESADITVPKNDTAKHEAVIKTVRGGIIITVYDEETGDVVPNAKVTITTPDGVTNTFVTNAKGQVDEYGKKDEFGNYTQIPGTFTYVVTEVPVGYKVTVGESQTGTVVADELTELIAKIAPRTGGLDITVLDEKTEKAVPNAKVEVVTPDGTKYELITDKNGMITKFAEKDATGKYTAKVGEYKITVTTVPEGYTVTTGQTKSETVEEGKVKHHVAKIAPSKKITITDTKTDTTKTNTKTDTKKTDTNAKTGDVTSVAGILAMMIVSLAAIGFIIRRKKEDEK